MAVLFLLLLRTPDTVIRFFESQGGPDRTYRADTPLLIKCAGQAFSRNAEQQFISCSHALIVGRARFADALCPVVGNYSGHVVFHGI